MQMLILRLVSTLPHASPVKWMAAIILHKLLQEKNFKEAPNNLLDSLSYTCHIESLSYLLYHTRSALRQEHLQRK